MAEQYIPPSDFLQAVMAEQVSFSDDATGEQNLLRLIAMTRDPDATNRDWAALLLSQLELDRHDVREALTAAASDEDQNVRAEAIAGLAQLDRSIALPFLRKELEGNSVSMPLLEAAIIVAEPSLLDHLEAFAYPSDSELLDRLVAEAIDACRRNS